MNINNISSSTAQPDIESTNINQTQTSNSNNIKPTTSEKTDLPNTKSEHLITNSKIQEGNFTASFQSAKLQSLIPNTTSNSSSTKSTTYEAQQIINANTSFFNLDENNLGKTLSTIAKEQPNLVKEVFQQLSSSDKVQVAQAFVDQLSGNNGLKDLAKSPEGKKLLLETYNILSNQQSVLSQSDPRLPIISKALVDTAKEQRSQTQIQTQPVPIKVTPEPQQSKIRELPLSAIPKQGNPEIRYELPSEGVGYKFYNRNDTGKDANYYNKSHGVAPELTGKILPDQIATKDTAERLETLAKEWNKLHPDRKLQYGDISLPGGVDTKAHAGHQDGYKVDVRPLRNDDKVGDSARLDINSSTYDRELTREFIQFVLEKYPEARFYFNDPQLIKEFPGIVKSQPNHNDHLHIDFSPTKGW
jgi:hypothetical protein